MHEVIPNSEGVSKNFGGADPRSSYSAKVNHVPSARSSHKFLVLSNLGGDLDDPEGRSIGIRRIYLPTKRGQSDAEIPF